MGKNQSRNFLYSVGVPESDEIEYSMIFHNPDRKNIENLGKIMGFSSYYLLFQKLANKYSTKKFLGSRKNQKSDYEWITYEEALKTMNNISKSLLDIAWQPDEFLSQEYSTPLFLLGFFGQSSIEWLLTLIACLRTNIVTVGLIENFQEFLTWSAYLKLRHLFTYTQHLQLILSASNAGMLTLKSIIVVGKISAELIESFQRIGTELIQFEDLIVGNGKPLSDFNDDNHPLFLSLTSGTTQPSRFAIISQLNLASTLNSCFHLSQEVSSEDCYLSYFNFSMLGDIVFIFLMSLSGGNIGLSLDPKSFHLDAQKLKPTFMIAVPQVIEMLYNGIKSKTNSLSGLSKSLFAKAYMKKLENFEKTGELKHKIWDSLVFKSIKKILGGRLRVIVVGSSLCDKDQVKFLRIALGCEVLEGYGLIESTVTAGCTYPGDPICGTMGGPLIGIEARIHFTGMIFDEFIHYYGELQIRGPALSKKYYGHSESLLSGEGWYSTGDLVGLVPETGALKMIDRIIFIYQSRSGRYISSQKLEILYKQTRLISQILCYGNRAVEGVFVVAVPDMEYVKNKWQPKDLLHFAKSNEFQQTLMREFLVIERIHKLQEHEKVVKVFVETENWNTDEFLTQTLKLRKYRIIRKYQPIFDEMVESYIKSNYN